jgi:hypothetical protein
VLTVVCDVLKCLPVTVLFIFTVFCLVVPQLVLHMCDIFAAEFASVLPQGQQVPKSSIAQMNSWNPLFSTA